MRTRLTVWQQKRPLDVTVVTDAGASVGDVADALVRSGMDGTEGSATLSVQRDGDASALVVRRETHLTDAGIASGGQVALTAEDPRFVGPGATGAPAVVRVQVEAGPAAGTVVDLPAGVWVVGRAAGCDVRLVDPQVSSRHARLIVSDEVSVADSGSLNGVLLDGGRVQRAVLSEGQQVMIGDCVLSVRWLVEPTQGASGGQVRFNRSPRVVPRYEERKVDAPAPPEPAQPGRFPWVAMVAPAAMGGALYAVTRSTLSLVFVALAPLLAAGTWLDKKIRDRQQLKTSTAQFYDALNQLTREVADEHEREHLMRRGEEPDTETALAAAVGPDPVLWSRRRQHDTFATLHLGYGTDASRTTIVMPSRGRSAPAMWDALQTATQGMRDIDDVPLLVSLGQAGAFGIAGAGGDQVACAAVAQLVGLHSPADLTVVAFASRRTARSWTWLKWLPHVAGPHTPIAGPHLVTAPGPARSLLIRLEEVVAARTSAGSRNAPRFPMVVAVVEDDSPADRGRLVRLAELGPAAGVHVLWCADRVADLPAPCQVFLDLTHDGGARLGSTLERTWRPADPPRLDVDRALGFARRLSAFVDVGAPTLDESDIPRHVSWLQLAGPDVGDDPTVIVGRWRETGSVLESAGAGVRRTQDATLRAVVGVGADGDFVLDLREHGPHALVGGTTGAGKSEFLQSWVLSLASTHSPQRVTFLFVDYKGGAAFGPCVTLPHCVGLVTDLSPHLVRRALTSLRAELRRREHLLAAKGAKDLLALERSGDPEAPPALVIVVDEFAALISEVPEFIDGVIDIAQRGRSLGLHLILATQRPAGVIKDNLRANTNLRVALRMADEHDSIDVVGSDLAAHFDPAVPGRGAVRTGPDRVAMFQSAYAGGHTPATPPRPAVGLESLDFGPAQPIDIPAPQAPSHGPSDTERVVTSVRAAARALRIPAARRPWLAELADRYDLAELAGAGEQVVFGVVDIPSEQQQREAVWDPDVHGNAVVFGAGGSGKSATLRTFAAAIPGPVHVYGIDAGAGGLAPLEELPQVGAIIAVDDHERVARLITQLLALLESRADSFARVRASSLADYRTKAAAPHEPRVLLLIDGLGALRDAYENDMTHRHLFTDLARLASEGRSVGVHVVLSAERPAAMPTAWSAATGYRLVLRQADENAYLTLAVPRDVLSPTSPPGRGVLAGTADELQVAVPGGSSDVAAQADALRRTAAADQRDPAPQVERLASRIDATQVPTEVDGAPVLGVGGDTLLPVGFEPSGVFLVAGSPGSGRSTALTWLAQSISAAVPGARLLYAGNRRSPAHTYPWWHERALSPHEVADMANSVLDDVSNDPAGQLVVLVVEGIADFIGTPAEPSLLAAIKAARRNGHLVIAEAETPAWGSAWPLIAEIRNGRRGLVLAPEQSDGEALFRVPFPRAGRATYPPGRGVLVTAGRTRVIQVPVPTVENERAVLAEAGTGPAPAR